MQLAASVILLSLGQVSSGPVRWAADKAKCLAVGEAPIGGRGHAIVMAPCGPKNNEGSNVQFTTTGTGPIHWAAHPGKCLHMDKDSGTITVLDCLDVVSTSGAQFVAPETGNICLAGHPEYCIKVVGGTQLKVGPCTPGAVECQFSSVEALQHYARSEAFVDGGFFSRFTFFDDEDPTHGKVEYVDEATARSEGFIHEQDGKVYIGSDLKSKTAGHGRKSVRIQTKAVWREGLFVISLEHVPTGCGTWPAMWLLGENEEHPWPQWGEYDIVEGTHVTDRVATTLHTGVGCNQQDAAQTGDFSGHWQMGIDRKASNCDVGAVGQYGNQGCSQLGPKGSMGAAFNANGGGTYAAEWDPEAGYIRTWFWPAGEEPEDLVRGSPDPGRWPAPYSFFRLGDMCPASHFRDMRLIFDLTFCGDLGNPTFAQGCPAQAAKMTCEELVTEHPELLQGAYWSIRKLDVYNINRPPPPATPAPTQPPATAPPPPPLPPAVQPAKPEPQPELQPKPQPVPQPAAPSQPTVPPRPQQSHPAARAEPTPLPPADYSWSVWVLWAFAIIALLAASIAFGFGFVPADALGADLSRSMHTSQGLLGAWEAARATFVQRLGHLCKALAGICQAVCLALRDACIALSSAMSSFIERPELRCVRSALSAAQASAVDLWTRLAPAPLRAQCGSAWEACRLHYDSMWEAVSALDWADETPLRKGDQVVVNHAFVAPGSSIFGTRLNQNTKGLVEKINGDGSVIIQFRGHLGRFTVTVPPDLQRHLQVQPNALDSAGGSPMDAQVLIEWRAKATDWINTNKRLTLGLGVAVIFVLVVALACPRSSGECSKEYLDCRTTRYCCDPTLTCYEKSEFWAACLPDCKIGVHYDEEPQWRSPWTCKVLAGARARRLSDGHNDTWVGDDDAADLRQLLQALPDRGVSGSGGRNASEAKEKRKADEAAGSNHALALSKWTEHLPRKISNFGSSTIRPRGHWRLEVYLVLVACSAGLVASLLRAVTYGGLQRRQVRGGARRRARRAAASMEEQDEAERVAVGDVAPEEAPNFHSAENSH